MEDSPRLSLEYSRDTYSSHSRNHYSARPGVPRSWLKVTLDRVAFTDRIAEGSFSGQAVNARGETVQENIEWCYW